MKAQLNVYCGSVHYVVHLFPTVLQEMKAPEQCFPVVLFPMLYNVVLNFESMDEILKCDYQMKSY